MDSYLLIYVHLAFCHLELLLIFSIQCCNNVVIDLLVSGFAGCIIIVKVFIFINAFLFYNSFYTSSNRPIFF